MSEPLELVVRLIPSDEVLQLREQVKALQGKLDDLQAQYNRVEYKYRCEVIVANELLDLCRANGINYRPALDNR